MIFLIISTFWENGIINKQVQSLSSTQGQKIERGTIDRSLPAKLKGTKKLVYTNTHKRIMNFQLLIDKEVRLMGNQSCLLQILKKLTAKPKYAIGSVNDMKTHSNANKVSGALDRKWKLPQARERQPNTGMSWNWEGLPSMTRSSPAEDKQAKFVLHPFKTYVFSTICKHYLIFLFVCHWVISFFGHKKKSVEYTLSRDIHKMKVSSNVLA